MIPFELVCGYSILPQNLRYGFFFLLLQLHFTFRGIIILSTHIVSDVELIAEKIILLREGQIAAFDTVAGLVGKSTLEDVYLTYFQKEA